MSALWSLLIGFSLVVYCASDRPPLSEIWKLYSDDELEARQAHVEIYQDSLGRFKQGVGRLSLLEIGVNSGRSMLSWIKWFEDVEKFVYVGVDSKSSVKHFLDISKEDDVHIEIRPDIDTAVLNELCTKYGPFDVIVDNGFYSTLSVSTVKSLYPCMSEEGFYIIENVMAPHLSPTQRRSVVDFAAGVHRTMYNYWEGSNETFVDPIFSGHIRNVQLMHDVIMLERAPVQRYTEVVRGNERIPLLSTAGLQYRLDGEQILNVNIFISGHSSTIPHKEIKAESIEICSEYPALLTSMKVSSVDECARRIRHDAISTGFWSDSDFLFGDDPLPK